MPQFDVNPVTNPGAVVFNTATGGKKPKKPKKPSGKGKGRGNGAQAPAAAAPSSNATTTDTSTTDTSTATTPVDLNNPLTRRFMTPNEIRAEAQRLAALSVPSAQAVQQQYAAEQAGIQGLTGALSARLGDIAAQQTAGLAGFGDLYSKLAGTAQTAGTAAAAAAGAPATAPGATPTVANEFARQAYAVTGYQPAAEAVGARLGAESSANLTKALVDRATRMSEGTAKYLQSLRDIELQRAISQGTLAQNQARLGLSQEQEAWNQQMDVANLGLRQQQVNITAQRAAAYIQKTLRGSKGDASKKIQSAKNQILNNVTKWTKPVDKPTGQYAFKFKVGDTDYSSSGTSPEDAWSKLIKSGGVDAAVSYDSYTQGKEEKRSVAPNNEDVIKLLQPILVNAGMNPNRARAWILTNVLNVTPGFTTYPGGVGGSGV